MISIPSKSDKQKSIIVDSIRILAWEQFKIDNNVSGKEHYPTFKEEWDKHEIHSFDFNQLTNFVTELGYTTEELLDKRSQYYQRRNNYN